MTELPDAQPQGFHGPDAPDLAEAGRCVRCGLCLPHCPTYRETYRETSSPRGRIHLIEAVGHGRLDLLSPGFVNQMFQCLDCRACEAVCPSGVRYGQLVEGARAQIVQARPNDARQRAANATLGAIFGDMQRFRALVGIIRIYQRSGGRAIARASRLLRLLGLDEQEALLPNIPRTFFIPADQHAKPATDAPARAPIAFFAGCVMSTLLAETDRATMRVLTAFGHPVIAPGDQECCGALASHAGELDLARDLARRNIVLFELAEAAGPLQAAGPLPTDAIVNNAAGCGAALKDYGHLFAKDPVWGERAAAFSARVRDITEILAVDLDDTMRAKFQPLPLRVTYQDPCHLAHAQHISQAPRDLLRAIPGLELVEMEESALCCGSAGVYNLTQPEMSRQLRQRKVGHTLATGADLAVTANPGCYLQLRAGLKSSGNAMGILHIIDLLDASLRGLTVEDVLAQARR